MYESFGQWKEGACMNKKLIPFGILLILGCVYAYLPISVSSTTYDATPTLAVNASATTIENYSIDLYCNTPLSSLINITETNLSDYWTGTFTINESGSWECFAYSYNTTDNETNSTSFIVSCPTTKPAEVDNVCYAYITIEIDKNLTYYDIGDNVTLWANLTNNTLTNSLWLYSSDNTTQSFSYSLINQKWYTYYTIRQAQEILIVQSFSYDGNVTGIGEFVLTYNPMTVTDSTWENLWTQLAYWGLSLALIFGGIIFVVFMGPMIFSFIFQSVKDNK